MADIQIIEEASHPYYGIEVPSPRLCYGVVKHPAWVDLPDPGLENLHAVPQPLHDSSTQTYKGATIPFYKPWQDYTAKINTGRGFEAAMSVGTLLINIPYEQGETPKMECVISGDNLVAWLRDDPTADKDGAVRILTYSHTMETKSLIALFENIYYQPWMFWRQTSYNRAGDTFKIWGGVDSFVPNIKARECWIRKDQIIQKPIGWEPTLPVDPLISWLG